MLQNYMINIKRKKEKDYNLNPPLKILKPALNQNKDKNQVVKVLKLLSKLFNNK